MLVLSTILISDATGTAKTTFLNAVASEIPDGDCIFVIQDTAEIRLNKPHVVSSESQSSSRKQEISYDELLKGALRHRPDSVILGEVRGTEARTLLDAMNTGHEGTLTTVHASSAQGALATHSSVGGTSQRAHDAGQRSARGKVLIWMLDPDGACSR